MSSTADAFMRLVGIMDELREKCPWDKKQDIHSLRKLTIEEMYELVDAIMNEDFEGIKEEIGDIFLHLVFYAKIAKEKNAFSLDEALNQICDKLIKRHPHIYGDVEVNSEEEVKRNWEQIKLDEGKKSVLEGVPMALPAMIKAYRLQEKTATVGFEWNRIEDVWTKVKEEEQELQEALISGDQEHIEEEFGDLLFALINYARFLKIDPEVALEKINAKFKRRFEYIELNSSKALKEMSLDEMDALWNEAKAVETKKGTQL
jgi:XTP/dITP diphosphohydrolase